jgi:L-ribulokinase
MGKVRRAVYLPDERRARAYDALFEEYAGLYDLFGRRAGTMRRLRAIRRDALAQRERRG